MSLEESINTLLPTIGDSCNTLLQSDKDSCTLTIINTIINNFYNREHMLNTKIEDKCSEDELAQLLQKFNEELVDEEKQLWTCFQYIIEHLDSINDWHYETEFILAYDNHKLNNQFYSQEQGFSYEKSFIVDFINHVMNFTTPSRDIKVEDLTILREINYILDVKYKRGLISNTMVWETDLWKLFSYIISSSERDTILDLWKHKKAFVNTLNLHTDMNQLYSAKDGWSYESSFLATLFVNIYNPTYSSVTCTAKNVSDDACTTGSCSVGSCSVETCSVETCSVETCTVETCTVGTCSVETCSVGTCSVGTCCVKNVTV